jgi:acetyltransferase-like isoleucine patch superfamily enzyme
MVADAEIHALALCEAAELGAGTTVAPFARIRDGARIGARCAIGEGALVDGGVVLHDRVMVGAGAHIHGEVELEHDVSIGSHTTFTNEPSPADLQSGRSAAAADGSGGRVATVVRAGVEIGPNATIYGGVEVGRGALIGAGTVVNRSVPPHAVVSGNPARILGYSQTQPSAGHSARVGPEPGSTEVGVRGVHVQRFAEFVDLRGSLTAGDLPSTYVPFEPRRWFVVYDVPGGDLRGEHAHRECHQFMVCVAGRMSVAVDDGERRVEVQLDGPTLGLYIPPMVWGSQFRHEHDTVLLVLASHPYDPGDYIREYEAFLEEAARIRPGQVL